MRSVDAIVVLDDRDAIALRRGGWLGLELDLVFTLVGRYRGQPLLPACERLGEARPVGP